QLINRLRERGEKRSGKNLSSRARNSRFTAQASRHRRDGSPTQLETELNHTAVVGSADPAEGARVDPGRHACEVHLVERVEELRPELDLERLADREVLQHAEVGVAGRRTADQSTAGIAVNATGDEIGGNERIRGVYGNAGRGL